jgi:hypothetical protein
MRLVGSVNDARGGVRVLSESKAGEAWWKRRGTCIAVNEGCGQLDRLDR